MPDIVSGRPTPGAPVASAWGQEVHDQVEGLQGGNATVNLNNVAAASVAVTFARPYVAVPVVVAVPFLASASYVCSVSGVTATGFTLWIGTRSGNPITSSPAATWLAMGAVA